MTDRTETDEILDGYLTADFDPLQAFAFDDDTDADDEAPSVLAEGPFNMPNPEAAPQFQRDLVAFDNGETAEERIDALFAQMPTFHKMLFTIMGTCASPLPTADLEEVIAEMKRHHHSVYEPLTLCNLLERAGAIAQTDENGTPLAEVEQEPLRVEVEGVEYWRVAPAPEVFWSLTEAGAAKLDSYRPMEMIAALYETEPQYGAIFTTCLELCARDGGASLREIGDVVDDEPEARWLSVCFYADMVNDPDELGDFVPSGLMGKDACCLNLEEDDPAMRDYILARLGEAAASAAK